MKKFLTLLLIVGMVTSLLLSGCAQPAPPSIVPPSTGTIEIRVTDAPARDEVTSIMVAVSDVEVHRAVVEQEREQEQEDGEEQNQEQEQEQQQEQQGEGEWLSLNIIDGANPFDLLEIMGLEEILAVDEVAVGKYTQIRMIIDNIEVTLGDGEPEVATLPSGELKFVRPFDVVEGETTVLLIDFDAEKSVTVTGQGNVIVKPVVKLTIKEGKDKAKEAVGEGAVDEEDEDMGEEEGVGGEEDVGEDEDVDEEDEDINEDEEESSNGVSQKESRIIAEEFVRDSATFTYDGIEDTLTLTDTVTAQCPSCWVLTFEFDSRHAGYGDRTDQILAEVITPHRAVISVEQGDITSAIMDGKWDMIDQKMLE